MRHVFKGNLSFALVLTASIVMKNLETQTLWDCAKAEFWYFERLFNSFLEKEYFFAATPRVVNSKIKKVWLILVYDELPKILGRN